MKEDRDQFKKCPKRYLPRGISFIYEDRDIVVVDKASGLLTVSNDGVNCSTAYYRLNNYVRRGIQKSRKRVFIVHRLDKDTSGVIVFAKSESAKQYLQEKWHGFQKNYYAIVHGKLQEKEGIITSYLAENSALRMYSVNDPGKGKLAKTGYKVLKETGMHSLLEISLLTGKKNQIRVHFADKGHPVVGDEKYGRKDKGIRRLFLHSASLTLTHPYSGETMTFTTALPPCFDSLMSRY